MNKKISVLTIVFSGLLSLNSFAEVVNDKATSEEIVTQATINASRNATLPGTDASKGLIGASVNAYSTKSSTTGQNWGQSVMGERYPYNLGGFSNLKNQDKVVRSSTTGFLKSTPKQVEQTGTDNLFYRYWITLSDDIAEDYKSADCSKDGSIPNDGKHPCECETGKTGGCWSPAYPIVSYDGFNRSDFDGETEPSDVKDYFGVRTEYFKPDNIALASKVKNQYNNAPNYRMGVKVAAHGEKDSNGNAVPTGTAHPNVKIVSVTDGQPERTDNNSTDAILSVQNWSKSNNGLTPDFNYSSLANDGSYLDSSDLSLVAEVKSDKKSILPCGMFSETSNKPAGVSKNAETVCVNDTHMRVTADNSGNPLYTYYHIALPTKDGFESKFTKDLKYRACAKCVSMASEENCEPLVRQLIKDGYNTPDKLVEALRQNFNGFKMTTTNDKDYATYTGTLTCNTCLSKLDSLLAKFASQLNSTNSAATFNYTPPTTRSDGWDPTGIKSSIIVGKNGSIISH